MVGSYTLGQQHRVSGTATFEVGSFYDGDKTTASYKGRVQIVGRLAVEPSVSLNWIDIPQGSFTNTIIGGRYHLHGYAADVRGRARPVQLQHDDVGDQRPLSLGVSAGE